MINMSNTIEGFKIYNNEKRWTETKKVIWALENLMRGIENNKEPIVAEEEKMPKSLEEEIAVIKKNRRKWRNKLRDEKDDSKRNEYAEIQSSQQ